MKIGQGRWGVVAWTGAVAAIGLAITAAASAQSAPYQVVGDGIPKPLTATPGSAARGKALLVKRDAANCLNCHSVKDKDLKGGGNRGPALDGVGAVLTPAQLRLSVVDFSQVSRSAPMPSFHKADAGATPRLSAQDVEDVVAFLSTLRN